MAAIYHRGGPQHDWRDGRRSGDFRGGFGDGPRGGPGGFGPRGAPSGVAGPAPQQPVEEINREKTCPLLMRVFPRQGGHHKLEEFADRNSLPDEIAIYTWMDADLRELSDLIKDVQPAARNRNARISFAFVYPDRRGRNVMRQVGVVHSTRPGEDDSKTLRQLNFQTGDYLDVSIY
ncbi:hypothetical protein Vretimale_19743 [Volvox reticuliferus]|uniref:Histone deacetylase complex subunit SAP18 n=1 Tax=Volvox reticuliferus TaxID=1737510 RepID=A0A8J4D0D5_9CHLO|nr:hypothetical protein Vretifemale_20726 [Volvox reticuliferus]GIM17238.1 hypothetical protein Vretimale_19743 [Volvox reticuliferus]